MTEENSRVEVKEICEYIFTPYITKKDGTVIYARNYGKKVLRIHKDNK